MAKKKINRRPDGLIEKKVKVPDGKGGFTRKSFYGRDAVELDILVTSIKEQVNKGTYINNNKTTFEQNIKKWYNTHAIQKEETTRESYYLYMTHAIKLLGDKKLQEIKPMDIQDAYNKFTFKIDEQGNKIRLHSENSLKHLHAVVNMSFKFAIENNILFRNPCDGLGKKIKVPEFEPYVYTENEFNHLLDCVKDTEIEVIVILAGGTGLRAGEICALKWTDIDVNNYTISVARSRYRIKGKTGEKKPKSKNSTRVIAVDPYIVEVLKKHPNQSDYVLCRSTGKPYRNDEIYHKFVEAIESYGLPRTRLHDLRHYNATMMAYYGVDVKTAAVMLGDNPVTMLKIYQHVQDKMKKEAAAKLGNMFKHKNSSVVKSVVNEETKKDLITTQIVSNPSLN